MPDDPRSEARVARHGEKMISLDVRFWTNDIAREPGTVIPKHAWASGTVGLNRNESHGIGPSEPIPFNTLMELPMAIETLLIREGISLHRNPRMRLYLGSP
ncbi:MAG TPA: hypothetical protein VF590_07465 [Isosphaeraceae bacterium]|jgi:hypothetical protein